jgi:adenine-specific DNA methylase
MSDPYSLEAQFDPTFTAILAQREKQIQQNYRPIIGIHKWFARRPGTVFRSLLLAEFNGSEPPHIGYWKAHDMRGIIADPFMGGGTPIFEANRLGFSVVGTDINPMAFWIVRQALAPLDLKSFTDSAEAVISDIEQEIGGLYRTTCHLCGAFAHVKYFLWVKTATCPDCQTENDLFPGYLLAEASRHPRHVVVCSQCGNLNEYDHQPTVAAPQPCGRCGDTVSVEGRARRNKVRCRQCTSFYPYPAKKPSAPPQHRMWAIEYYCERCKPNHDGRFFKQPDVDDFERFTHAKTHLKTHDSCLPIPHDEIPNGVETKRLHRWGYTRFREMFNERQLLGLGLLLRRISEERNREASHALLTVFSDFLRYQNMLCRYDTYALKCQDIFSVHGFPVGLIQCENNVLGIPKIGAGAFRHFVEKYLRAKHYCLAPFETRFAGRRKDIIPITGERIQAEFVTHFPEKAQRQAYIQAMPATQMCLPPHSLDGVFTDPPYFDNVQYAELMDFCFVWLRLVLQRELPSFTPTTTRTDAELTGNTQMQRGLVHFTQGLSDVFCHYAAALKVRAPFVFTYHHNDPMAYVPLVVAILDAGLDCTATLPAPAEMGASLHIAHSKSSVLDTVFVCRKAIANTGRLTAEEQLKRDVQVLISAGLKVTEGDMRCLLAGHIARITINQLRGQWDETRPMSEKMSLSSTLIVKIRDELQIQDIFLRVQDNI